MFICGMVFILHIFQEKVAFDNNFLFALSTINNTVFQIVFYYHFKSLQIFCHVVNFDQMIGNIN